MEITAAMVKALRDMTGLSMMDCKQALVESGGDSEKAVEVLRKKGAGRIEKMVDRETTQGRIAAFVSPGLDRGGIVELRCETAPVAKTDDFIGLAATLARLTALASNAPTPATLAAEKTDSGKSVADVQLDVFNRLRENMVIARVAQMRGSVGAYVHHNGMVGALVEFNRACPPELAKDIAMHVTAARPLVARREEVDPALIAKERALAAEQVKGKPPQIVDKIVSGKIDKWMTEIVLLEQPFVKDDKQSVASVLKAAAPDLTVTRFARFEVGGA